MYLNQPQNQSAPTDAVNETKPSPIALDEILPLTNREREVLVLVAEGYTSCEIADIFLISPETVEIHRGNIIQKFGVQNIAHAVAHALRNNLIK